MGLGNHNTCHISSTPWFPVLNKQATDDKEMNGCGYVCLHKAVTFQFYVILSRRALSLLSFDCKHLAMYMAFLGHRQDFTHGLQCD